MISTILSFATSPYEKVQSRLHKSAKGYFDCSLALGPKHLAPKFRDKHAKHFKYTRGYGFWIWKPWLILQSLKMLREDLTPNAVLMYCDSQLVFVNNPDILFDHCELNGGILLFDQANERRRNGPWTKRRCFDLMDCIGFQYVDGWQINAAMSLWMPTPTAFALLEEWYGWCSNFDVICDDLKDGESKSFKDHRHDQSILSLLAIKHGIRTYTDPSQYGNFALQQEYYGGQVLKFDRIVKRKYPIPCLEPTL